MLLALLAAAAMSVLALASRWWWTLELCTHFRAHYFAALAIGAAICVFARRFKLAIIFAAFALYNFCYVLPLYLAPTTGNAPGLPVRLMTVNARCNNYDRRSLPQLVADESPDVVLFMEVDAGWTAALKKLADSYRYRINAERRDDCFGIALFSKLPVKRLEIREIGPAGVPSIFAQFENENGSWFYLVGTHPVPPVRPRYAEFRNRQLEELGRFAATLDGPVVLLGDLNSTSWSPYFVDLLKASGLRDSRRGFGNQPTWHSRLVNLGIAIDHVLVSPEITVQDRHVGPNIGSDHRPVIIDLAVPVSPTPVKEEVNRQTSRSIGPTVR